MISPSASDMGESKISKQQSIQRSRHTTILQPILQEMHRICVLKKKQGEVTGILMFNVKGSQLLILSAAEDTASLRTTLYRRIVGLSASRVDDDTPYYDAVKNGRQVTVVLPLPEGFSVGGWRCHAVNCFGDECLQSNKDHNSMCLKCSTPLPKLKPEFKHLRLLSRSIRSLSRQYLRIIKETDAELTKCERAEHEARERLASSTTTMRVGESDKEEEEELMMNVELMQQGVWNRVHASTVLAMIAPRHEKALQLHASAKAELTIMIQDVYQLAAPHAQKVIRGFLLRASKTGIREEITAFAELSAALEIQRIVRSALATIEAIRLRKLQSNQMATRVQCMVRKRAAYNRRIHLWSIHIRQLREKSAVKIQNLCRGHICKLKVEKMADERVLRLRDLSKKQQANQKHEAATKIQAHVRRQIGTMRAANKRVEIGLHQRLLLYIERFSVDGDFFSLMKHINDDYIRFERTITSTIEREEKMAKTFVDKVVSARDIDHNSAWEKYSHYKQTIPPNLSGRSWDQTKRTAAATRKIYSTGHGSIAQRYKTNPKRKPKTEAIQSEVSGTLPDDDLLCYNSTITVAPTSAYHNNTAEDQHASHLVKLSQYKHQLRGQYLNFDIPSGLDDTVARFITAVSLRYNFSCPRESTLHNGSFVHGSQCKEHQQEHLAYAESLVQRMHGQGLVFIRQLLPTEHMSSLLASMKASPEFIVLACQLIVVLHQVTGGNYMSRRYLMNECRHFLTTQKELSKLSFENIKKSEAGEITSRLAEFCPSEEYSDEEDDIPGGLWGNGSEVKRNRNTPIQHQTPKNGRKPKTWAVAYTKKILEQNDTLNPAYSQYRHYPLLSERIERLSQNPSS